MKHVLGFTLIEVLVVLAIMGVLMSVGVASYNKMNDQVKIEEAARGLESQIRAWQKEVDSGVGSQVCVGSVFGGLKITNTSTTVTSAVVCNGVSTATTETFPLTNGAQIQAVPAPLAFIIKPLGGGMSNSSTFVVQNGAGSIQYQMLVSRAGGTSVTKL